MRAGLIIAAALLLSLAACRLTPHPDSGWGLNPGSSWPGKTGEPPRLAAPLSSSGIAYLREEVPPGVNPAQWALAWCLKNPVVTCVIPGCKSVEQVEGNAAAADLVK